MQNRISDTTEQRDWRDEEPQPVGVILEELLVQYERRFPDIQIMVVETAATAV
jgi:hypothetical protein